MSVRFHEAVCFDSTKYRLDWRDDFWGDSLDAKWRATGTGSAAVVDAQDGGIVRLTTGATAGNSYYIDWQNIRSLLVSKKLTMEARIKTPDTTNCEMYCQLLNAGNVSIMFWMISANANYRLYTNDGGATAVDSGIAKDTDYHIFRIECFPTGEVHFYIDDVECTNSPITTTIPAVYLQPRFLIYTSEDVAKSMDIDYVYVRQDR